MGICATIIIGCLLQYFVCCRASSVQEKTVATTIFSSDGTDTTLDGFTNDQEDSIAKEKQKTSFIAAYNQDPVRILYGLGQIDQALDSSAVQKLNSLWGFVQANPDVFISVFGYGDSSGTKARNLTVTTLRAEHVKSILIAQGFAPERIEAIGMGDQNPAGDNATEEGRALNRRVEVLIK